MSQRQTHTADYQGSFGRCEPESPLPYPYKPPYAPTVLPTVWPVDYPLPGYFQNRFDGRCVEMV